MDSRAAFTRLQALVCVVILWAAIYLPCLGSLEIKGEEGRRLLPAVAMLEGGSWIVPQIGGVDYLSKPPLINWLAAASLRVAAVFEGKGTRTEWAARAPSVLAVLALALVMTGGLAELLTPAGALFAATCTLTNLGLMEKGRLAEIEALYISLYGIALVLWLGGWRRDALAAERGGLTRPTWHTWTLPWVFLGLGLLTKGPLHLLFFYAVVLAVIGCAGRWREFLSVPHLVGVAVMLGMFALWAVPYFHQTAAHRASGVWLAQFQGRLEVNEGFRFGAWLLNVPRGLINFLPWAVLLPLGWRALPEDAPGADRAILVGGRWATLGCFLAVSLAPGGQPRYTLPLLVPASVLLGLACRRGWDNVEADGTLPPWLGNVWSRVVAVCLAVACVAAPLLAGISGRGVFGWITAGLVMLLVIGLVWRVVPWKQPPPWERVRPHRLLTLTLASAVAMALLTWNYAVGVVPHLRAHESVRPAARAINEAIANDPNPAMRQGPLTVLQPGFLPFLYYVHPSPRYIQTAEEMNFSDHWLLVNAQDPRAGSYRAADTIYESQSLQMMVTDRRAVSDKRPRSSVDPKSRRGEWYLYHLEGRPMGAP